MASDANREIAELLERERRLEGPAGHGGLLVRRAWWIAGARWSAAALLFWWFWEVEWVRWSALAAVPALAWFTLSMRQLRGRVRARHEAVVRTNDRLLERS